MSTPIVGLTTFHTRLPHKSYAYISEMRSIFQGFVQAALEASRRPRALRPER